MEFSQVRVAEYAVSHRHDDGSWAEMDEVDRGHPASHDPERRWPGARLFRCRRCDEAVTIIPGEATEHPIETA